MKNIGSYAQMVPCWDEGSKASSASVARRRGRHHPLTRLRGPAEPMPLDTMSLVNPWIPWPLTEDGRVLHLLKGVIGRRIL